MKFGNLLYLTLRNFGNRKSRLVFTILGVAVAIAAVFSLVSLGYGLQSNLLEQITSEDSLLSFDVIPGDPTAIQITDDTLATIAKLPNVEAVSPEASFLGEIIIGNTAASVGLNAVDSRFLKLDGATPEAGTLFTSTDERKEIIITSSIANLLNENAPELIGKAVQIRLFYQPNLETADIEVHELGEDFIITGVVPDTAGVNNIYIEPIHVTDIPIRTYTLAKVKMTKSEYMPDARTQLIGMGFLVSALSDVVDQANKIFRIIQSVLGIFGVIALVVAAIGLINTMTIALLERTNEIGIMRAIGAAPKNILFLFLSESAMIGFFGGLSGLLVGFLGSEGVNVLFNIVASSFGNGNIHLFAYPLWFIGFIIILSTGVGLIGGFWPAYRASRMNPLDALKYK